MIPAEAVEAAMRAIYAKPGVVTETDVRLALEAALPYLASAARQPQRTSPTDWPDVPSQP